jgi:tRNA threonylcarbamoyladenosine biosynthesis protein TsaE
VSAVDLDTRPEVRIRTAGVAGTRSLGAWLAAVARPGDRIALSGALGAGKTQVAKGFAAGLGVREVVNSPSFTLMAEYDGRLPMFHQDLYRLEGVADAFAGGLLDERQDLGVTLSEWADRLGDAVGDDRLEVRLVLPVGSAGLAAGSGGPASGEDEAEGAADEPREIVLRASPGYERYLERARAWPGEGPR